MRVIYHLTAKKILSDYYKQEKTSWMRFKKCNFKTYNEPGRLLLCILEIQSRQKIVVQNDTQGFQIELKKKCTIHMHETIKKNSRHF